MSRPPARARVRVALLWYDTIISERVCAPRDPVTVGAEAGTDVPLPGSLGVGRHTLLEPIGDGYALTPTPGMTNATSRELTVGDRGLLRMGEVALFYEYDHPDRLPRRAPWRATEPGALGSLIAAVALHFGVLVAAFLAWDDAPAFAAIGVDMRDAWIEMEQLANREPEPPPEAVDDPGTSAAAPGEEGTVGEPERQRPSRVKRREGALVRGLPIPMESGVLKRVFTGSDEFARDLEARTAGHDSVDEVGQGTHGLGYRLAGTGGGGDSFGQIHGMGRVPGLAGAGGTPKGRLAGRKERRVPPTVKPERPRKMDGFCDQADILRVVERRSRGITACYESALRRDPELGGKVTMRWLIGRDGRVVKVHLGRDDLGAADVVRCMKRVVQRWRFEKPEGGVCMVSFPFVFSPGK